MRVICSPIELDTDGAILQRQGGGPHGRSVVAQRVRTVTQHPVAAICRTLGLARQTAYAPRAAPPAF
jgi:hypothetical protein